MVLSRNEPVMKREVVLFRNEPITKRENKWHCFGMSQSRKEKISGIVLE